MNRCNLLCKILRVFNILRNLVDIFFEINKVFFKIKLDLVRLNKLDILFDILEILLNFIG